MSLSIKGDSSHENTAGFRLYIEDGAQANEARFGEQAVSDIVGNLTKAGVDIIECGF